MASAVKSVEIFTISMANASGLFSSPEQETLGKSQDIDQCVPFVTKRVTTTGTDELENQQVSAWFTSTDTLNVGRDATSGALEIEVAVVEFSSRCTVHQSAQDATGFTIVNTAASSDDAVNSANWGDFTIPSAVVLANSFLVFHSYQNSATGNKYSPHLLRGRLTGTTEITIDRGLASGTINGHWYVVESDSGDFTVDALDVTLTSATSNTGTVSVTAADTLVLGSWKATGTNDSSNRENTVDVTLSTDGTTVTVERANATGTINWSGFVIEMSDGTSVQRDTWNEVTSDGDEIFTLGTPVSLTASMAVVTGNMGSTVTGSFQGTSASQVQDAQCQLTLQDSDTGNNFDELRIRHNTDAGVGGNSISFEVIEWELDTGTPPATRRVMVIS